MVKRLAELVFLVAVCAVLLEPISGAMTMAQLKNAGKMFRNTCAPKSGVSKDALAKLSNGEVVDGDKKLNCYFKCVQGMMQANKKGRYNAEQAMAAVMKSPMLPPDLKTKFSSTIEHCKNAGANEPDACDLAYEIVKCGFKDDPEFFFP